MLRKYISQPTVVTFLLIVQFIPLLIFPADVFSPTSQQWWLPVLLTILAIFAMIKISVQRSDELWPWYLVSFSHGFNIISRLMMLMPHATNNVEVFRSLMCPILLPMYWRLLFQGHTFS